MPGLYQVKMDTPAHPRVVKENMIHQTRPPSYIAPWFGSLLGILLVDRSQHGHLAVLVILTPFYQNQLELSGQFELQ